MVKQRLLAIVRVLAAPEKILPMDYWMDDYHIDSIELINRKTDFKLNVFSDYDGEFSLQSYELCEEELKELVEELEKTLLN